MDTISPSQAKQSPQRRKLPGRPHAPTSLLTIYPEIVGAALRGCPFCERASPILVDSAVYFSYATPVGTRETILEAAVQLFSTHGYAHTSLAQVAREARVSKALVLWYFETKEQLFQTALEHFLAPYAINEDKLFGLSAREQLDKLINDYSEFIAENVDSVKFMLGQVIREEENSKELVAHVSELYRVYRGLLATILERGQKVGVFTRHVKPTEDAAVIMATLNGVFVQQIVEPENADTMRVLLGRAKQLIYTHLTHVKSSGPDKVSSTTPDPLDTVHVEQS